MSLLSIFANNLLPVLLLMGAGFMLGKFLHLEPRPLGRVIFYVLSPLLVFNLITTSQLSFGPIVRLQESTRGRPAVPTPRK